MRESQLCLIFSHAQYVNRWVLAHEQRANKPDRIESPGIEAGAYRTLARKGGIQSSGEYKDNLINGVGINWQPSGKKGEHYLIICARINSRQLKDLNMGSERTKLLGEIRENSHHLRVGKAFIT